MPNTEHRNRKIFHLLESAVSDFCKIIGTSYSRSKEAVFVEYENEGLFYVFPEFNKSCFTPDLSG